MKGLKMIRSTGHRVRAHRAAEGFTLIELMVVIVIIAALATIVGVNLAGTTDEADITAAKGQISNFKTALMAYKLAYKKFPDESDGLNALIENDRDRRFIDATQIPKDPWGNDYVYKSEDGTDYEVLSYGADGQPGGSGINADISSRNLAGDAPE